MNLCMRENLLSVDCMESLDYVLAHICVPHIQVLFPEVTIHTVIAIVESLSLGK